MLNREELIAACTSGKSVVFVDFDLLAGLNADAIKAPIIALMDVKPAEQLSATVNALDEFQWLSHVLSVPMLQSVRGTSHVEMLLSRIANGVDHIMLGANGRGRTAMLASASRREARFERMREYFAKQGLGERLITTVIDVAEELVMNALYDAPVEAGFFQGARQRFEDVNLPPDRACEISYGIEDDTVFIRLRDPFGALSRSRLRDVLNRCNSQSVQLDESRGGAGLGLWRVFQAASTISITVVPEQLTEVLVGIGIKDGRKNAKPAAVHMFFAKGPSESAAAAFAADDDLGLIDNSITFVHVA